MRLLAATFDAAGNLPPLLGLVEALVARGHETFVIGHGDQRREIESSGASFLRFERAPEWALGAPIAPAPWDVREQLGLLDEGAGPDILEAAARLQPAVVLVDCMLRGPSEAVKRRGYRTVSLVHALYSFFVEFLDGCFRGPIDESDLALGLTYAALDPDAEPPPNFAFVGPLRPSAGAASWRRKHSGKRFVLVSPSSGAQSTSQWDLWQRVCDALAGLDVEALVTTGRGLDPESLSVGRWTSVERRVPHDAVLGQADLLITHAGHGTVAVGVRYGVPMLCLPAGADQPFNAASVARLGLGEALAPSSSSAEIRAAAARMLDDAGLRARCRAFAAVVAREPGRERAVELVEALAARDEPRGEEAR